MTRPIARERRFRGRRLGDPVDIATAPGTRAVRGRLAAVSVRASLAAGAWVGFALGIVFGAVLGGVLVWFAGAVVDWQRDLAFTLGVARRLLPFGDQIGLLRDLEARWWIVVPGVALAAAALSALVGGLLGGIFAALYNRSPRHATVVVELPDQVPARAAQPASAAAPASAASTVASPRPAGEREPHARPLPAALADAPADAPSPARGRAHPRGAEPDR